ncbi:MAG TPA: helix-turn-helix domain-containing protein [Gammaproteobacteria bacterium]
MSRSIPADRFGKLIGCATEVLIRQGYRRTQMSDVAEALGVAKGTLYLYVESKEALLDLALRHADDPGPIPVPDALPVRTPEPGATLAFARERSTSRARTPRLQDALERDAAADVAAELEAIVREAYGICAANKRSIKLIDRCAQDRPDLGELWFRGGREGLMGLLVAYLTARPQLAAGLPDVHVTARVVVELIAFWAVHRHWDPHPQRIDEKTAEDTVAGFVVRTLASGVDK